MRFREFPMRVPDREMRRGSVSRASLVSRGHLDSGQLDEGVK